MQCENTECKKRQTQCKKISKTIVKIQNFLQKKTTFNAIPLRTALRGIK